MDLCMPSGEIVRSTFAKSNILPVPQLYKALRKTSWGGLFPAGTGDEDNKSVLMKNPKKTMTGLSSIRVKQRLQQEAELLSRNSVQNKKSDVNDVNPTTKGRRSNLRNAQQQPPLKATKTLHEAQVVPGKNVPFHSTFLRSKEYINRDETAMMEKEKETMKIMKIESKRRSISKMGDAFRKRQAAKQGDAEEIEAN